MRFVFLNITCDNTHINTQSAPNNLSSYEVRMKHGLCKVDNGCFVGGSAKISHVLQFRLKFMKELLSVPGRHILERKLCSLRRA